MRRMPAVGACPHGLENDVDADADLTMVARLPAATPRLLAREIAALDAFASLRALGVGLVRCLRPADLARTGLHPDVGHLTVSERIHERVHPDRNHPRQIMANVQRVDWPAMGSAQRPPSPA